MKKIFLLLLCIMSILSFSACSETTNDDIFDSDLSEEYKKNDITNTVLREISTTTNDGRFEIVNINPDVSNIMYLDFATNSQFYLCSDLSCSHDSSKCTSAIIENDYLKLWSMFTFEDEIITFTLNIKENAIIVNTRDLNGKNISELLRLPANLIIDFVNKIYETNGKIYFMAEEVDEKSATSKRHIVCVDLINKKYEFVHTFDEGDIAFIMGAYDSDLIINYWVDDDNEYISVYKNFNVDDNSLSDNNLIEINSGESAMQLIDDSFYTINYDKQCVTKYNFDTNEEYTFNYNEILAQYPNSNINIGYSPKYDNIFMLTLNNLSSDEAQKYDYIVDIKTGEYKQHTLEMSYNGAYVSIVQEFENELYVTADYKEIKMYTEQGEPFFNYLPVSGFIKKEDFFNSNLNYRITKTVYN